MNRTIRFSLKTAMKHIMTVRNMFADGDTYFTKLNSNLTANSRQVRRTILAYMLQDGVIFKLGDTKATWNPAVDTQFLTEWAQYIYETHNKPKKTSGKVRPIVKSNIALAPGMQLGVSQGQPLFQVTASSAEDGILQLSPWTCMESGAAGIKLGTDPGTPSVRDDDVDAFTSVSLKELAKKYAEQPPAPSLRGHDKDSLRKAAALRTVGEVAAAVAATDKNGQHSIQGTCDALNNKTALKGRPATSYTIHDEVDNLVFLTSKEAVDIVKAMNSLVRDYTALIHSGKDPLILRETVAGRLANMALRPLRNQGVQG